MKAPFIIYAGIESLLVKTDTFHNNPKNSLTAKINKHRACSYSLLIRYYK